MEQRWGNRVFPVGLYGALVAALCALALPTVTEPAEKVLLGAVGLPLRFWSRLQPVVVEAGALRTEQVAVLQEQLQQRLQSTLVQGAVHLVDPGLRPEMVPVVARRRPGGSGLPSELVLGRRFEELAGCAAFVTSADAMVGFLARPGQAGPADEDASQPARVLMLHHPESLRVAASMQAPTGARPLHLVVEAAASLDPWPLRTSLWDDPYGASRFRDSGAEVRSMRVPEPWGQGMPTDLLVGRARIWGYESGETIGVYVEPAIEPRAISHVVVWRQEPAAVPEGGEAVEPVAAPAPVAVQLLSLPGLDGRRLHASWSRKDRVADGAAVSQGGVCIGTVRTLALGQGLVSAFHATRHSWSLLLLPEEAGQPVLELQGTVEGTVPGGLRIGLGGATTRAARGWLFTGSNGPNCPAGLVLGRVVEAANGHIVIEPEVVDVRAGAVAVAAGGNR